MISKDDAKKLAELSRLKVSDEELESVSKEINSILEYVGQIKEASADASNNVVFSKCLREDADPNETGKETETLLNSAPKREGNYVKVKKMFS